jgi:hypothetical protein
MRTKTNVGLRALAAGSVLFAVAVIIPATANAQCGTAPQTSDCYAPARAIFDLGTTGVGGTVLNTVTQFTTTFTGDGNTEYVSFAFRESPAYWLFTDASVTTGGGPNLLTDTDFSASTDGQNCNHNNSLGCPVGWGAWIQSVDVDAIGQVADTVNQTYGCGNMASVSPTTNFWCDGSVEGYDALYQAINSTNGATYTVSWYLDDNSNDDVTGSQSPANLLSQIDMLVYAGDQIPVGAVSIGSPTPEPSSFLLLGMGLVPLFFGAGKRMRRLSRS